MADAPAGSSKITEKEYTTLFAIADGILTNLGNGCPSIVFSYSLEDEGSNILGTGVVDAPMTSMSFKGSAIRDIKNKYAGVQDVFIGYSIESKQLMFCIYMAREGIDLSKKHSIVRVNDFETVQLTKEEENEFNNENEDNFQTPLQGSLMRRIKEFVWPGCGRYLGGYPANNEIPTSALSDPVMRCRKIVKRSEETIATALFEATVVSRQDICFGTHTLDAIRDISEHIHSVTLDLKARGTDVVATFTIVVNTPDSRVADWHVPVRPTQSVRDYDYQGLKLSQKKRMMNTQIQNRKNKKALNRQTFERLNLDNE